MTVRTVSVLFILVSIATTALIQNQDIVVRAKRQWGPWQQQNWNNQRNRNKISAQQNQYNCQTSGINLMGLPISSYNCQNSGMSARVNSLQSSRQNQGFMQGPLGGFFNNFMGRK